MRSRCICLAVATALCVGLYAGSAHADLNDSTHNGIKGAVGLGLLGADLTLIIEGAVRVRNPLLLSLIPITVAGGSAVGGWYLGAAQTDDGQSESWAGPASVGVLVAGLALIIPAAILVAYGRFYRTSRDDEGFVDRTEEGMPYESETRREVVPDGETQTEVVGPEEGDDTVEPAPEPEESRDDESGPSASEPIFFANINLSTRIPVGGMLRVFSEETSRRGDLQLSLTYF